jgi:hypothetical protein
MCFSTCLGGNSSFFVTFNGVIKDIQPSFIHFLVMCMVEQYSAQLKYKGRVREC